METRFQRKTFIYQVKGSRNKKKGSSQRCVLENIFEIKVLIIAKNHKSIMVGNTILNWQYSY
jgi:hypothetical protein